MAPIRTLVLANNDQIRVAYADVEILITSVPASDDPRDYAMLLITKCNDSENGDGSCTICGKSNADRTPVATNAGLGALIALGVEAAARRFTKGGF